MSQPWTSIPIDHPTEVKHDICTGSVIFENAEKSPAGVAKKASAVKFGPVHRSAMGEYIPPVGQNALSAQGFIYPGPADYNPRYDRVMEKPPSYSVVGMHTETFDISKPGPADYNVSQQLEWKCKRFTFGSRQKSSQVENKDNVSPATYLPTNDATGSNHPQWKIARRYGRKVQVGLTNNLQTPADLGVQTPGFTYSGDDGSNVRGPMYSLGLKRKEEPIEETPGPSNYALPSENITPKYTMGGRLPHRAKSNVVGPGPGKYNTRLPFADKPLTIRSESRSTDKKLADVGPAPNAYNCRLDTVTKTQNASMPYRTFEFDRDPLPGPADYSIKDDFQKKKAPSFTMKGRTKAPYPVNINSNAAREGPGPASYNDTTRDTAQHVTRITIGGRHRHEQMSPKPTPGPNQYDTRDCPLAGPNAPKFTIASKREPKPAGTDVPSAAEYLPNLADDSTKWTIAGGHKKIPIFKVPGPNAYQISSGLTRKGKCKFSRGVSMRSRQSPYVFSGFPSNLGT